MPTRKKLIHVRKPKLRVSSKGVGFTKPSARIGGKAGFNLSSRGISASVRTKAGTASTKIADFRKKKPGTTGCLGCSLPLVLIAALITVLLLAILL